MSVRNHEAPKSDTREYFRLYYAKNKDRIMATPSRTKEALRMKRKAHYKKYRDRHLAKARERRSKPGYKEYMEPIKRKNLMARYGITHEIYLETLAKQGGKCAICGTDDLSKYKVKYFDVDHNHTTGQVRGLLCRDCNVTTGVVENKWDKIQLIRQYIAEWNAVEFDPKDKQVPVEER